MKTVKHITLYCFLLSLLIHFLLVAGFTTSIIFHQENKKSPSLYIPSYVYQNPSPQAIPQESTPENRAEDASKYGINKKSIKKQIQHLTQMLPANLSKPDEPVHLIGEDKEVQPLLVILGKALTKRLLFPKAALDFSVKGTSVIGFIIYPDGHLANLQLLKSSGAGILDNEALAAASAISPIANVGQYVKHPQFMVIGIIFG